jgi:prophage regulatory protein
MAHILLKLESVERATTLKKPTIYAGIKSGIFPAPIKTGVRSVAWLESDIQKWIDGRVSSSTGRAAA